MEVTRALVSYALRPRPRFAAWRARWKALTPLTREIVVILAIKVVLLSVLWFAFFRAPLAPHMTMEPQRVEGRLIGGALPSEVPRAVP